MMHRSKDLAKHYKQAQAGQKKFQRFQVISRAEAIEEKDDRTVEVIFSSDEWIRMWYGEEKLEHGTDNVDLSYFNARMSPVLIDHRYGSDYQVGVIESARVGEGMGHATIRFGQSAKADEYYRDVIDGIRSCLSVGYEVQKWEIEDADERDPKYIATEWTPREISLVTFPADDSVGVIRSERKDFMFELQPENNEEDEEMMLTRNQGGEPEPEATPEDKTQATPEGAETRQDGGQATPQSNDSGGSPEGGQQQRAQATVTGGGDDPYAVDATRIIKLTTDLNESIEKAYRAIEKKQTFAQYEEQLRQERGTSEAVIDPTTGELHTDINEQNRYEGEQVEEKDKKQFRLTSLVQGVIEEFEGTAGGFEKEICDAEAERRSSANIPVRGFAIPGSIVGTAAEYQQRQAIQREMQERAIISGTDASGGYLVDSELRPEAFIDALYGEFAVSRAVTMLMDVKGDIAIPKQDGKVSATWKGETAAADESNPTFEEITLSPHRLTVKSQFSRTFALQSTLDAENLARRNVMRGFGAKLDSDLIYGSGASNQIDGVTTLNAIDTTPWGQRINYTKANLAYSDCLSAIEKLGNNDIPMSMGIEWMASWKFWKDAKQKAMLTNGSIPIWYEDMICDFPANVTSQIKQGTQKSFDDGTTDLANADHAFVGNWMYLIVAIWGGMDIVIDPFTLADSNQIRVVGHYLVDSGFAYDEAFIALQRTA